MNITSSRESFLRPLQAVIGVVERQADHADSGQCFIAGKGWTGYLMTASDLEVELVAETSMLMKLKRQGKLPYRARKFLDICRSLPDESTIKIQLDGDRMVVKSGRSRFVSFDIAGYRFPGHRRYQCKSRNFDWSGRVSSDCSIRHIFPWLNRMFVII